MTPTERCLRSHVTVVAAGLMLAGVLAAACGSSGSKASTAPTTPAQGTASSDSTGGPGRGNRTLPAGVQTSIAQGTPRPFRGGTPPQAIQTAIAQGTPAGSLRGNGGRGRALSGVATLLSIDETQLQTELQTPGATIASVAATHGFDRQSVKQALIDTQRQRLSDSVANGRMSQSDADAAQSQFEANLDQLLDSNGSGAFGAPAPGP
jgi:hypothetical protein